MHNDRSDLMETTRGYSLWHQGNHFDETFVTIPIHLAYCGIAGALRHFASAKSLSLAVLAAPEPDALESFVSAGRLYLRQVLRPKGHHEPFVRAIKKDKKDKLTELELYRRAAEDGTGILLCSNLDQINEEVKLFADIVAAIPRPTSNQIAATFRRFGHRLTKADEEMVASESWTRLVYAFQPDRSVKTGLRRLRETADRNKLSKAEPSAIGPNLSDLSGLGPAQEWGLELARDLVDFNAGLIGWEDIDTGALLSGPPGTGKTLYAEALARTCGLPIVATSAAQWQAHGYLNDLLKAMRDSFDEARSRGTAILLIDELDAIGSRQLTDAHNVDYKRQVINGLLEALDGYQRRTGVIVIGATNHPENIDPAILRPGRLDRHFVIPLPDSTTRRQIFQFHAGFPVPKDEEEAFRQSTEGMTGAGIKQLVRDGRRAARREGKQFIFQHVAQVAEPLIDLPEEYVRVAAVHESGHAVVGCVLGMDLQGIRIASRLTPNVINTVGGALFAGRRFPLKTRSYFLDQITLYLAGIAAETLAFGEFTEGATDHPQSDLSLATALATKIEASFGMGDTLAVSNSAEPYHHLLRAGDIRLRTAVSDLLESQFQRAKEILFVRMDALHEIADTLLKSRAASDTEVREIMEKYPRQSEPELTRRNY